MAYSSQVVFNSCPLLYTGLVDLELPRERYLCRDRLDVWHFLFSQWERLVNYLQHHQFLGLRNVERWTRHTHYKAEEVIQTCFPSLEVNKYLLNKLRNLMKIKINTLCQLDLIRCLLLFIYNWQYCYHAIFNE